MSSGYQSIGSFHSDNLEYLMSLSDKDYTPPQLPFEPVTAQHTFMLDRTKWTFLNHGAFGAALKSGYDRANQWRYCLEQQPLRYFDRDLLPHLVYSARRLSDFIGLEDRSGLALVPNVTSALNTVIAGYVREHGDTARIVVWDVSYGSVKKMARQYCSNVVEIDFFKQLPQLHEKGEAAFMDSLEEALSTEQDWTGSLLILDQTTSNTAMNLPIAALADRARKAGMLVLVDGAHGLLAQEIDFLSSVDFYVSNGHKWLSCPRGVAMMYCGSEHLRETILRQPAIVSHGVDDGYFSRFAWDGCRDYAAQLALSVVLDAWNDPAVVRAQLRFSLTKGVDVLTSMWHPSDTESPTTLAPMSLHSPMALVRLPDSIAFNKTSSDANHVQDYLFASNIEVPIKCIQGTLYVRVSCHVYNQKKDFEHLSQVMLKYPN